MDKTVLDLAKNKKIADFADVVKAELKKKVLDNEYIKSKAGEVEQYQKISNAMAELNKSTEPEKDVDTSKSEETDTKEVQSADNNTDTDEEK